MAFALAACGPSAHQETPRHSDALIVCPGAQAVSWVRFEGTDQLGYQANVEYPADSIISCISKKLSESGWRPLKEDFWNPGLPSSHVRGWTQFTDATVHPEATVDQWASQWENATGDVVWYSLRYVYPPGDRHRLAVNAGLVPVNIAKKMSKVLKPVQTDSSPPQETSTPQNIARAMFPSAPDKAQSVECFRGFSHSTPVNAIVQKCGRPDEELGSGVYIFVWHLADGSKVSIDTPYLSRIDYFRYTDASGKSVSLLNSKK